MPRRPPLTAPTTVPRLVDADAAPANDRVYEKQSRNRLQVVPPHTLPPLKATDNWRRGILDFAFSQSAFTYALIASLAIHGVLFALKFKLIDFDRIKDRAPPLEVALVNAKSESKPAKAEILAQANLEGGGNVETERRARTPMPVLPKQRHVEEIQAATERVEKLEQQTKELMTQMQSAPVATAPPVPAGTPEPTELPSATVLMQKTLEVMRLEAQIAKDVDQFQKKPRRKHLGVSAEEYRFARYVEDWRQKVERVGNLNYPEAAREMKLYGNLILTVSIRADGSVERVAVERSSGRKVLDAAAIRIVEMAAPYAPFPKDIERDTDVLDITRTWTFAKGDELRSD